MPSKLAPLLVASLLAVASCATEAEPAALTTGAEAVALVRSAPDAAAELTTARFELVVEVDAGEEAAFAIRSTGAVDRAADRLSLDLVLPMPAGDSGGETTMQIVMADGTTYLRLPFLASLTGTDRWLAVDTDVAAGFDDTGLLDPGAADPTATLEVLRNVADRVDEVGEEPVRGVPTTRYRAQVDLEEVLAATPVASRFLDLGETAGPPDLSAVPVEVWLDADGLLHRLQITLTAAEAPVTAALTLELFDHGQPAAIAVPSPDQVDVGDEIMSAWRDAFLGAGA